VVLLGEARAQVFSLHGHRLSLGDLVVHELHRRHQYLLYIVYVGRRWRMMR